MYQSLGCCRAEGRVGKVLGTSASQLSGWSNSSSLMVVLEESCGAVQQERSTLKPQTKEALEGCEQSGKLVHQSRHERGMAEGVSRWSSEPRKCQMARQSPHPNPVLDTNKNMYETPKYYPASSIFSYRMCIDACNICQFRQFLYFSFFDFLFIKEFSMF